MINTCREFRNEVINQWDSTGVTGASLVETEHYRHCDDCREFTEEFKTFSKIIEERKSPAIQLNMAKLRANIWKEIDSRTTQSRWWEQVLRPAVLAPAMMVLVALSLFWLWPESGESPEKHIDQKMMYSYAINALEPSELPETMINLVAQNEFKESIREYMLQQENYSLIQDVYGSDDVWEQVLSELTTMQL